MDKHITLTAASGLLLAAAAVNLLLVAVVDWIAARTSRERTRRRLAAFR